MHNPDPRADLTDIGAQNVERLLGTAYRPEEPDPEFVQLLNARLCAAARSRMPSRNGTAAHPPATALDEGRLRLVRRRLAWGMGLAAAVAISALIWYGLQRQPETPSNQAHRPDGGREPTPAPERIHRANYRPVEESPGLTAQARPEAPTSRVLKVGESLTTRAGERRRTVLADGSTLYLNQGTRVTQTAPRQLTLSEGEVYVEVA